VVQASPLLLFAFFLLFSSPVCIVIFVITLYATTADVQRDLIFLWMERVFRLTVCVTLPGLRRRRRRPPRRHPTTKYPRENGYMEWRVVKNNNDNNGGSSSKQIGKGGK
jgi:hypothetical protein